MSKIEKAVAEVKRLMGTGLLGHVAIAKASDYGMKFDFATLEAAFAELGVELSAAPSKYEGPTLAQILKTEKLWSDYAGEPVRVEKITSSWYAYGSELACLRLEHKMRCGRANYSENLKTWYYCNEGSK